MAIDAGRHPNIELITHSEVEEVNGFVGNFEVKIRKKARYVDHTECNSCGECSKVCPVVKPDEFQAGLSSRKAIYIPFPQAVPSSYILNMQDCLGNNPIACGDCADVCEKECIDYDDKDEIITREVGSVVVAIGLDVYAPTEIEEYGYRRFPNVITSMEFERLICAGGPTAGHFVRPGDQVRPKRIGFVQCVGSRNPKIGKPYCSNICCMNTIKDTLLLADHYPDVENVVIYQDIRAFGKSFEDMFQRSKEAGTRYVRGLPGEIEEDPETGNLLVTVENTTAGRLERHELDMVVLSIGVQPPKDLAKVSSMLTLSKTSDGFFMEAHPKLKPVDAPTKGVYFAGFCESPKDIKEAVCQAGAASSRAAPTGATSSGTASAGSTGAATSGPTPAGATTSRATAKATRTLSGATAARRSTCFLIVCKIRHQKPAPVVVLDTRPKTLELQPSVPGPLGQSGDTSVVQIAAAVEDYPGNFLFLGQLGDRAPDRVGGGALAVDSLGDLRRGCLLDIDVGQGLSLLVVDDLGVDVPIAAVHRQPRTQRGPGDLLAHPYLALLPGQVPLSIHITHFPVTSRAGDLVPANSSTCRRKPCSTRRSKRDGPSATR